MATLNTGVGVLELKSIEDIVRWTKDAVANAGKTSNANVRQTNVVSDTKVDPDFVWFGKREKVSRVVCPAEAKAEVVYIGC